MEGGVRIVIPENLGRISRLFFGKFLICFGLWLREAGLVGFSGWFVCRLNVVRAYKKEDLCK